MKRLLLPLMLFVAACGTSDAGGATPGTLTLRLAGGGGNDGAVLIVLSGGPVQAVDAAAGYQIATETDGAGTHVIVVGNLAAGAIATIHIPDAARAAAYVAEVVQVSDRDSFVLLDPARYQATIGP